MKDYLEKSVDDITGFRDVDKMISGLPNGNLIVVGGRPSMGKTTFALCVAKNMALVKRKKVIYFSLEMSREMFVKRLIASKLEINLQDFIAGRINDNHWDDLCSNATVLANSGLILNDTPGILVDDIYKICLQLKEKKGIDLVIVDYLQLISAPHELNSSRQKQLEYIFIKLKLLAFEMKKPVIVISQLSRAPETREDKHPVMSDFRETIIGRKADTVMIMYREDYYNKESIFHNLTEIMFLKRGTGGNGKVCLEWDSRKNEFKDYEGTRSSDTE
ncbi:DnaB-like helicase C-terminal domain-containing protein [Oribacterium sp. WCC10]|uniref:DnaB-like helicase C-terminal domain-containing protein n=1 Tax=Oribacterium sp. WCC10 TaxID=1855343 RepID=UPI0008E9E930|nr:DnaB-like helicase C-terminal domain-containing protein [Oribacterium sp. WCC10]SFG54684.1 replicative DNA helicase [Oribacterium sp. WCC10]